MSKKPEDNTPMEKAAKVTGIDASIMQAVAASAGDALEQIVTSIELSGRCALAAKFVVYDPQTGEVDFLQEKFEACYNAVCNPPEDLIS
jgi:hypothetical protein